MNRAPDTGRLGFGSASIGNLYRAISDEASREVVEAAWDGGIRYFDTAPHYGVGVSERRLGAVLREKPRDEFVVSTKVGRLLVPNPSPTGRDTQGFAADDDLVRVWDPSADGVRRSLEESLVRMGLDRIDILYLHDPDNYDLDQGLREGLPGLIKLRDEGLVSAIGVGVNSAAVAARAVRESDLDIIMVAGRYSLLDHDAAEDLLPLCAERGVSVVDAAVFNSGLLSQSVVPADAKFNYSQAPEELIERARAIAAVCDRHGVPLPAAALQWPLRNPAVATVVVGTGRVAAVEENLRYMDWSIPDALWVELIELGLLPAE